MKRLVLIDGHSVLYRAYHAYPPLTTSKGELVNAVYGFVNIVLNVISDLAPTHLAVAFDMDKPTFRHLEFTGYKAQREEMPTDLADQQERVRQVVKSLNVPIFSVDGYEADDVLGTLARQAISNKQQATKKNGLEVVIVTSDMDALQLVESDGKTAVRVYVPGRGKRAAILYDERRVEEKYDGLEPEQVPDMKGLAGDSSDNIPGVKGVGQKTATKLLREFKTVEGVYKNIGKVGVRFGERIVRLLVQDQENAVLSERLATIDKKAPITLKFKDCEVGDYDKGKIVKLFKELEFVSLIRKLPKDKYETEVKDIFV